MIPSADVLYDSRGPSPPRDSGRPQVGGRVKDHCALMPQRLCSHPGCGGTVTYRGYCAEHARAKEQRTARKGTRIYHTARWRNTRKRVLFDHPLCQAEGCGEIATDVDHIVPLPEGDPYALSNLQALCRRHHGEKTRREQLGG